MGFSCTIKQGKKEITGSANDDKPINYQLFGLAPNSPNSTDAPHRLNDLRSVVAACAYGDRLKEAAQDCFTQLQRMAEENLMSLAKENHCETCSCASEPNIPDGWSAEDIKRFLKINPKTITYLKGGW